LTSVERATFALPEVSMNSNATSTFLPLAALVSALVVACGATHEQAPASGPTLHPLADGVRFQAAITHPFLPYASRRSAQLAGDDERVELAVLERTHVVGGVECTVLTETEFEDGELVEISYNYFAQDEQGNVYYFGEDVDDYEDGKIAGHGGAWLVGRNAREPCLFMPAVLEVGFHFKRENSPPHAEEFDLIERLDGTLEVGGRRFADLLVIVEGDKARRFDERKYYARGIGLISENGTLDLQLADSPGER
jgi:hypothetical protein